MVGGNVSIIQSRHVLGVLPGQRHSATSFRGFGEGGDGASVDSETFRSLQQTLHTGDGGSGVSSKSREARRLFHVAVCRLPSLVGIVVACWCWRGCVDGWCKRADAMRRLLLLPPHTISRVYACVL